MELLTLKAASARLGICIELTRAALKPYGVIVGKRLRYPLSAVQRIAERGTR